MILDKDLEREKCLILRVFWDQKKMKLQVTKLKGPFEYPEHSKAISEESHLKNRIKLSLQSKDLRHLCQI